MTPGCYIPPTILIFRVIACPGEKYFASLVDVKQFVKDNFAFGAEYFSSNQLNDPDTRPLRSTGIAYLLFQDANAVPQCILAGFQAVDFRFHLFQFYIHSALRG
jgi:hypothetical protein